VLDPQPFRDKLWLAPLTFGGNLPFRRLCVELGAEITVGEMALVRNLLRGEGQEFALLRSHASEPFFGAQLADRDPETLAQGTKIAAERGARFVDLNCGCPIHDMVRRGLGSQLLQKPGKLGRLVASMVAAVEIPITVKVRTGWTESEQNISEIARVCEESGASALTIHGRTREQRYTRAADWDLIGKVAKERTIPVVGNGDILTWYECRDRMARAGVTSVMLARGALIKPWLFREIREQKTWLPSPEERFSLLWRFVELLKEHFRDDEKGRRRALKFLPWHLEFFRRYRPMPEGEFEAASREHPLLQTRWDKIEELSTLERLLRDARPETHQALAKELIASASHAEALERAQRMAVELPAETVVAAAEDERMASG
jgi:tRNA-dihydrouridine synthase 3